MKDGKSLLKTMYTNNSCTNADGRGFCPKHTVKSSKCFSIWQPASPEPDFHWESTWRCPLSTELGEEEEGVGVAAPKAQPLMQRAAPTATNLINILTLCDCVIQAMGQGPQPCFWWKPFSRIVWLSHYTQADQKGTMDIKAPSSSYVVTPGQMGAWWATFSSTFHFLHEGIWAGRLEEHCGLALLFTWQWIHFCFSFSWRQHLLAKSTGIPSYSSLVVQAPACSLLCFPSACSKSREGTEAESQSRAWQGSSATGRVWGRLAKPLPCKSYLPNREN